jgi:hypothetical protein
VQQWVALVLALTVLVLMLPRATAPFLGYERTSPPPTVEELTLWRDVLMVLIGALAGYIGGRPSA